MIWESLTPCKNPFLKREVFAKMGGDLVILIPVRLKEPKPASSADLMCLNNNDQRQRLRQICWK